MHVFSRLTVLARLRRRTAVAFCRSLIGGVAALLSGEAWADTNAGAAHVLDEVVVTATKRSETVQDVPLSITAIGAQTLEAAGVTSFFDYADKVPNLTFASGHGIVEGRTIAIRGIQGTGTTGFYIDDMPVPESLDPRVVDLARIEVLRGPQGTLYGARSMGGTVRLITETPDLSSYSGRAHGLGSQVDGGGGGYQTDATVNLPIVSNVMAIRLTGFGGSDGAFIRRTFPASAADPTMVTEKVARNDFVGGTASLLWKVTDAFSVRPTIMTQYSTTNGFPLSDTTAGTLMQLRPLDVPEKAQDKWTFGGMTLSYATAFGDITSASSWFSRQSFEVEDYTQQVSAVFGTPNLPATFLTMQPRHSFVEELRFVSRFSGPLQVTVGAYAQRGIANYNQYSRVPGLDSATGGALGTDLVYQTTNPHRSKEDAVFGELSYQMTKHWSVTGGLRYSRIDNSSAEAQTGIATAGFPGGEGQEKESSVTPKLVVKYEVGPDLNYYALAAKGFRPGGSQVPPPPAFCAADYASAGVTPEQLSRFNSDALWNYEIGAKSRLLDRRVTLNMAAYWIEWSNLQQTLLFRCGYPYTGNVGKARSRGAEVEFSATPIEGLNLTIGVGYTDAQITASSPLVPTPVGAAVQQIAPWTASLAADYSFPLKGAWRGVVRLDNSYVDHSFSATNDVARPRLRPSYDIANVRVGATTGGWDVMAFVSNLGNTHANLGDNASQAAELAGRPRILVNSPRTIGVEGTLRW